MRVALYFPDGAVASYRLGRIVEGTHTTDILTGNTTSVKALAEALAERAKEEYPECTVKIEKWHDNGDDTSCFIPIEEAPDTPLTPSEVVEVALTVDQEAELGVNS